jgi:hypothetical protein
MKWLSDCPIEIPTPRPRAAYVGGLRNERSDQWFVLTSDQTPFVVYTLDHPSVDWEANRKRPDGVLVAELDAGTLVCFLELKGRAKSRSASADPNERARAQLRGGMTHFGPALRTGGAQSHGDLHHDQWLADDVLEAVSPASGHLIAGVTITFHSDTKPKPLEEMVFGKRTPLILVQVASNRNRAELSLESFLNKAGLA